MKELIKEINSNHHILTIGKAYSFDVISYQKNLTQNNLPKIPLEMIDFLKIFNGIGYDLGTIYGINVEKDILPNILEKNLNKKQKNLLYLGEDNFNYLAYNQKKSIYQIIDKSDYEVLKEYEDITDAIMHIIKI